MESGMQLYNLLSTTSGLTRDYTAVGLTDMTPVPMVSRPTKNLFVVCCTLNDCLSDCIYLSKPRVLRGFECNLGLIA